MSAHRHPLQSDTARRHQATRDLSNMPMAPRPTDPWLWPTLLGAVLVVAFFVAQVLR